MKKVLIVTYYWPPSGGGGVQRWLKFAKYLPRHDWQPLVLTPANPDFQHIDHSLLEEIPGDAKIFKKHIWEPYSLFRRLSGRGTSASYQQGIVLEKEKRSFFETLIAWFRGNIFIPDPRIFWVRPAVRHIGHILDNENIDTLVTTGPPHSMHLIGLKAKKKYGLPWIADLRDPWSDWDILEKMHVTPLARKMHRHLERNVFVHADLVLTVSDRWASDFRKAGANRVEVITNGYDPKDFGPTVQLKPKKFRISHIGLLNEFRSVPVFWKTLSTLCTEQDHLYRNLEILLAGMVSPKLLATLQNDPVLGSKVQYHRYIPHADLHKIYQSSAALLLVLNNSSNAPGHIPGKLFEYLAARRPIIALGPLEGDAAKIINTHNPLPMQWPENAAGIRQNILEAYGLFLNNKYVIEGDVSQFSRQNLAGRLARILDGLVS